MADEKRKWHRRKTARPAEIIEAALTVFAERGFEAATTDEIAARAGIAKGAIYRYFDNKEELFRAVIRAAIVSNLDNIRAAVEAFDGPFDQLAPALLMRTAMVLAESNVPAVANMVLRDSRQFPDLARAWYDDIVAPIVGIVTEIITCAQARGEVRKGDSHLQAFSLFGPILMAGLFSNVFAGIMNDPADLKALALQHARNSLEGLLTQPALALK
jgi:AcrR family transcriptional regulator